MQFSFVLRVLGRCGDIRIRGNAEATLGAYWKSGRDGLIFLLRWHNGMNFFVTFVEYFYKPLGAFYTC